MALIIGVVIVLLILFGFLCYKKAPPTEAIVVTGFGLARPKVVCGKGTFVLPVLQRADRLNMRLLKIDVKTPETGVKTQNGVSLWIDSVVTIQVYSENSTVLDEEVKASGLKDAKAYIMSRQQAAISNFLGMNEQGINDKVNDVLQGNLREIVSDMTVDQILTNRKQMALSVIENARPDLAKMGLEVVTFNVQDIRDAIDGQGHNHGVIEAIGIEQEELVKKQAEIARAQAARDVACAYGSTLTIEQLEQQDENLPERLRCVWTSYVAVRDSAEADNYMKGLMRKKVLSLLAEKHVTVYRVCKDTGINRGRLYRWLNKENMSAISCRGVDKVLRYLDKLPENA